MRSSRTRLPGIVIMTLCICLLPFQVRAANSALLELIEILKNKGSITEQEYQLLQKAAAEDQQQAGAAAPAAAQPVPEKTPPVAVVKAAPAGWTGTLEKLEAYLARERSQ